MGNWTRLVATGIGATLLVSCSIVDTHLDERITAVNKGVGSARNDGILLNVIRAGQSEPLSFVAVSKVSGTQNTDLKLGLPTITIGKGQTTAQKQAVFASNSWENSANSSFDSAPLESGDFYKAASSSVDLGTMEAFIRQGYSRELVFNTLIASIRVTSGEKAFEFRNDPNLRSGCPATKPSYGGSIADFASAMNEYAPGKTPDGCEYRHFEFLLQAALEWGLTIEAVDQPKTDDASTSGATVAVSAGGASARASTQPSEATSAAPGGVQPPGSGGAKTFRFCFDQALANPDAHLPAANAELKPFLCGAKSGKSGDKKSPLKIYFGDQPPEYAFDIRPRSTLGLFRYIAHANTAGLEGPWLYWPDSEVDFAADEVGASTPPLINILGPIASRHASCFARAVHPTGVFCVPTARSTSTRQVFAILAQLLALDPSAAALPTTLDVRLQ